MIIKSNYSTKSSRVITQFLLLIVEILRTDVPTVSRVSMYI